MIEYYFNYSLFPDLSYLVVGWSDDLHVYNVSSFQGEIVNLLEVIDQDNSNWILNNPQGTSYNAIVGYTADNELVFIYEISIFIIDIVHVFAIQFNLHRILVSGTNTINVLENLIYDVHNHDGALNNPKISKEISKFSNYQNEMINDELNFCNNKVILRNLQLENEHNCNILIGETLYEFSDLVGLYDVDFRFESMPRELINRLPDGVTCFTYRGDVLCYRLGNEYHILNSIDTIFNYPVTLITEYYAVDYYGQIYQWDLHPEPPLGLNLLGSWDRVGRKDLCKLVSYRAAFTYTNNELFRIL